MIILNFDNENARDPDVVYHKGKYYCLYSYKDALWIKSSDKIEGLLNAKANPFRNYILNQLKKMA